MGNYSQLKVKLNLSIQKGRHSYEVNTLGIPVFGCENGIEPAEN